MKTILVPTDLSSMTHYALDVAVGLARTYEAEIVLLHTVLNEFTPMADCVTGMAYDIGPVYEQSQKEAEEVLDKLIRNPRYTGVTIKPSLGSTIEGLIRCINEQPADLIVLASKGSSGLMEWLEGSHAELIVRHAHCPVLVVKQPMERFQPKRIVCALDVEDKLKETHTYPFLLADQDLHQFVYVQTPGDHRKEETIRAWMNDYALVNEIDAYTLDIWPYKTVAEGILNYANDVKADLLVLYTHGRKGLRHWLEGSVAEDVLNHASMPVLILRA